MFARVTTVQRGDRTYQYLRDLILHYPNSHFVLEALPDLLRQMSKGQQIEFLTEIIEKHPKTRACDLAQESLQNLQDETKPKE